MRVRTSLEPQSTPKPTSMSPPTHLSMWNAKVWTLPGSSGSQARIDWMVPSLRALVAVRREAENS